MELVLQLLQLVVELLPRFSANERYTISSLEVVSTRVNIDIGPNNLSDGDTVVIQGLPYSTLNGTFTLITPAPGQLSSVVSYEVPGVVDIPAIPVSGVLLFDVTSSTRITSQVISKKDRWAYLGLVNPGQTTVGAAYAKLTVTCTPSALVTTQAFKIDKAVFRE
jgi:hypothetical protein